MNGGTDSTVPDLLSIAIASPARGVIVAHIRGELDMYSAPELDHLLGSLLDERLPRRLVLDLTELQFLGSRGVAALLRLQNQTATAAGPEVLRLVGLRPPVIRVLALTGALALFNVHDNVEGALAGVNASTCRRSPPALTARRGHSRCVLPGFLQVDVGGRYGSVFSCFIAAAPGQQPPARSASTRLARRTRETTRLPQ
jgi:anti-sigma B factor antagonist